MLFYTAIRYPGRELYFKNRSENMHMIQTGSMFPVLKFPSNGKDFATVDFFFDGIPYSAYIIAEDYSNGSETILKKEIRKRIRAAFMDNGWKLGNIRIVVKLYNTRRNLQESWEYTCGAFNCDGHIKISRFTKE